MFFYFIIVIISLIVLVAIHEFGHFILAKKFGIPIEEFGLGLPPRIWGVKIGATLYSINWLPLGAFVKVPALEGDERNNSVPTRHKVAILLGGVVATWLAAVVILSFVAGIWGLPFAAQDGEPAQVQIIGVLEDSPASQAGLKTGDLVLAGSNLKQVSFGRTEELISFLDQHRGENIILKVQRGSQLISVEVRPRLAEESESALGVMIGSIVRRHYSWHQAPWAGFKATVLQTVAIPVITADVLNRLVRGEQVPGARLIGPIGIVQMAGEQAAIGWDRLFMIMALIAIYFTIFNLLPLPALDGGRLLFLAIEKVRGRAPNAVLENRINNFFFIFLIGLLILISIKDIFHLFN